jgi:hypothetical protein
MLKKITIIAACLMAQYFVFCQDKTFKFSAGPGLSIPTGGFSNSNSTALGAGIEAEIPFRKRLYGVVYGGWFSYPGKEIPGQPGIKNPSLRIVPLRVGVKYFFVDGFYGMVQAGFGFFSRGGSSISAAPHFGYEFEMRNGNAIDLQVLFDVYSKDGGSTFTAPGIRIAYVL